MSDIKELKDEQLEKVSGGIRTTDCANCGYFKAKNPDGGRNSNNCSFANASLGTCKKFLIDGGSVSS